MTYLPTMTTGGLPEDSPANAVSQSTADITPDPAKMDAIAPKVIEALKTVYDPEIPVNIFEMGLIYDVIVDATGQVGVKMTLTAPACPGGAVAAGRSARQGAQRRGRDRREGRGRLGSAVDEGPHVGRGEAGARDAVTRHSFVTDSRGSTGIAFAVEAAPGRALSPEADESAWLARMCSLVTSSSEQS